MLSWRIRAGNLHRNNKLSRDEACPTRFSTSTLSFLFFSFLYFFLFFFILHLEAGAAGLFFSSLCQKSRDRDWRKPAFLLATVVDGGSCIPAHSRSFFQSTERKERRSGVGFAPTPATPTEQPLSPLSRSSLLPWRLNEGGAERNQCPGTTEGKSQTGHEGNDGKTGPEIGLSCA